MPDGSAIEDVGIKPDVTLNFPAAEYRDRDPTWDAAVQLLRDKTGRRR